MPKLKIRETFWEELAHFVEFNILLLSKNNDEKYHMFYDEIYRKFKVNLSFEKYQNLN